ncbi:hypothetical protein ACFHYO_16020 [Paracoccus panacisoli]|uniref:Tetratricopeptide repeat protein n=1 Tax=Paracoccus panacisoli TaxID=1510163 RepID=A0ABV6TC90_9RHOB
MKALIAEATERLIGVNMLMINFIAKNKTYIFYAAFLIFFILWSLTIVAGFGAKLCANSGDLERRISSCTYSIWASGMIEPRSGKRALVYLQRGLLHAETGNPELAISDFSLAVKYATGGNDILSLEKDGVEYERMARLYAVINSRNAEINRLWDAAIAQQ